MSNIPEETEMAPIPSPSRRRARAMIHRTILAMLVAGAGLVRAESTDGASRPPMVAVTPMVAPSLDADAQESIASALASSLLEHGGVRVLERSHMDQILREQGFSRSGACDSSSCDLEIGKLLAVDQIVAGRVGKVGNTWTISARRVSVRSGEVLRSVTRNVRGEIDQVLTDLVPQVAAGLLDSAGNAPVAASGPVGAPTPPKVSEGSRAPIWPWILGGTVVVGGGAVAAVLLLSDDESGGATPAPQESPSEDVTVRWSK